MTALRSALIWTAVIVMTLLWLPVMAVVRLLDRDPARYTTGRAFRRLGAGTTRVNPLWRVQIEGDLPEDPRRPYVVVANHQSLVDIPVLCRLPWEMKWVAKAELFRVPVVGWMLKLAHDIPVKRLDRGSRARALRRAVAMLEQRCSVMFFPEGTRSPDGRVQRFTMGAFRLAIDAGVPVLPIAIDGTQRTAPKHGWQFRGRLVARVGVLEPVETEALHPDDAPALAEQIRQQIIARIAAWRGVPPEAVDGVEPPAAPEAGPPPARHEA